MKAKSFLAVLGIFAFLFVIGCSNETAVDNPTANNGGTTIDMAGKNGGIKVDSYNSGGCAICPNNDLEDNTIAPSQAQLIWVSQASANSCAGGTIYYTIVDNPTGQVLADCAQATYNGTTCGSNSNFVAYTFTAPGAGFNSTSQSATMTVYCGDCVQGVVLGGDSFRLVNNGNCIK